MLEDRAQKSGRPVDETMEMELLKEYGSPQKGAQTCNPKPYLIGPRLYPTFIMVLKIVLAAVSGALLLATGIEDATRLPLSPMEIAEMAGETVLNILSGAIGALGQITLIFVLIERFAPVPDVDMETEEEWNPASLMKEPDPQKIKSWEPILGIVFLFIVISILDFNRELLEITFSKEGIWFIGMSGFTRDGASAIPLFSEAFFRWLPLMNAALVAEILRNGLYLRNGRWSLPTRLFSMGIKIGQIVIHLLLISGPFIPGITVTALTGTGRVDAKVAQDVMTGLERGIPILLGIGIFGWWIEIGQVAYQAVADR